MTEDPGGRIFFSSSGRALAHEDEIVLLSVGVDIGSSTSHLAFSRILLERLDSRYVVSLREAFYQSDILLTPYRAGDTIDAEALGAFIDRQYRYAAVEREEIDAGALILTGTAARRRNARAIGDLFAREAGRLVAVSAGDALEATMAAHGSGAVARSLREQAAVMNVDVGGGTAKIAVCVDGRVVAHTALDVGARLVCLDADGRIQRIEEAGHRYAAALGLALRPNEPLPDGAAEALSAAMAEDLFAAMRGEAPQRDGACLLRLDALAWRDPVAILTFSGGVAEYLYGREQGAFCDLGPALAGAIRSRTAGFGAQLATPAEGIRATAIGAAQYTTQLSGSTVFIAPQDVLPLRNVPVLAPALPLDADTIEAERVAEAITHAMQARELTDPRQMVALFVPWRGSATFARLDGFCRGVADAFSAKLAQGIPLVLAGDGDVGGLIGMHLRAELGLANALVSIDGIELKEFDFIDIGALLDGAGAVPVVIKSLLFPAPARDTSEHAHG